MRQCSDLWETQGFGKAWIQECAHPEFRYWGGNTLAPESKGWIEKLARPRTGKGFAEQRPVYVAVYGDMAYMFSHWVFATETSSGERTNGQRQTTDVFRREGGKWLFLAEYESPNLTVAPRTPN
ncbi:MAG: nuclear transport factor 2 family protein [Gemmatimonadetes bacterium]|nr:nuclear transport factor 2 family protein [Gemmatimonadota bacterium]